jgi:DNA-3-methyladenine glycosylase
MRRRKLARSFYARPALEVAPDLIGALLRRRIRGRTVSGRIVEVEAYLAGRDPASHAYRGRTARNAAMFGPPGRAYVYFTYGNHFCVNVVTGKEGEAEAVLIRALEPVEGIGTMRRRRGRNDLRALTSGPGRLTQALGIGRAQNGADFTGGELWIEAHAKPSEVRIGRSRRIGIRRAVRLPYRFFEIGSPFVSGPRQKRRPRRP